MLGDFFKINTTDLFINTITLLIVYVISIMVGGFIAALIIKLMGDDTPEYQGFMSLNPINYISPIGLFLLLTIRIGFSKAIEINSHNIKKPYRDLKLFIAYMAEGIGYFVLGFVSLLALVKSYGLGPFLIKNYSNLFNFSTLSEVALRLLVAFVFFNFFCSVIFSIFGIFKFLLTIGHENRYNYVRYLEPLMIVMPILIVLLIISTSIMGLISKFIFLLAGLIYYIV